jgi:hypothetical protein
LGAPLFLFQRDRIDQIAAATAVASTDRSKSRWKNKPTSKPKRKRSKEKTSTSINQPYELTTPSTTLARHT